MKADIAVFDSTRVSDKASFNGPLQYAGDFWYVIVNGQTVHENGAVSSIHPGESPLRTGNDPDQTLKV